MTPGSAYGSTIDAIAIDVGALQLETRPVRVADCRLHGGAVEPRLHELAGVSPPENPLSLDHLAAVRRLLAHLVMISTRASIRAADRCPVQAEAVETLIGVLDPVQIGRQCARMAAGDRKRQGSRIRRRRRETVMCPDFITAPPARKIPALRAFSCESGHQERCVARGDGGVTQIMSGDRFQRLYPTPLLRRRRLLLHP